MKKMFLIPLLSLSALIGTSCGNKGSVQLTLNGVWGSFSDGFMAPTLTLDTNKGTKLIDVKGYLDPIPYFPEVHTFNGWSLDMYGENKIDLNYVINDNTTIYAQWDVKPHPDTTYLLFNLREYYEDEPGVRDVCFHYTYGNASDNKYPEIKIEDLTLGNEYTKTEGKISTIESQTGYKYTTIHFQDNGTKTLTNPGIYVIEIKNEEGYKLDNFSLAADGLLPYDLTYVDGNTHIYGVALADSNEHIPAYAYATCDWLMAVELPKTVTTISECAFWLCISLDFFDMPANLETIKYGAFFGCPSLHHVYFNNKLKTIKDAVFYGCASLASVHLPDSLETLGEEAFRYCVSNKEITFGKGLKNLSKGIFSDNHSLESVTIPNTIEKIGDSVFEYCSSLRDITFEDGGNDITFEDKQIFPYCVSLTHFIASKRFKTLGARMFNHTLLSEIDLTACDWVVTMGEDALGVDTPIANGYGTIIVPKNKVEEYKAAEGWKNFASLIVGK